MARTGHVCALHASTVAAQRKRCDTGRVRVVRYLERYMAERERRRMTGKRSPEFIVTIGEHRQLVGSLIRDHEEDEIRRFV